MSTLPDWVHGSPEGFDAYRAEFLAALHYRETEARFADAFEDFLATEDERPWDAYVVKLGRAHIAVQFARSRRRYVAECTATPKALPGCDCSRCFYERIARGGGTYTDRPVQPPSEAPLMVTRDQHERPAMRRGSRLVAALMSAYLFKESR